MVVNVKMPRSVSMSALYKIDFPPTIFLAMVK